MSWKDDELAERRDWNRRERRELEAALNARLEGVIDVDERLAIMREITGGRTWECERCAAMVEQRDLVGYGQKTLICNQCWSELGFWERLTRI